MIQDPLLVRSTLLFSKYKMIKKMGNKIMNLKKTYFLPFELIKSRTLTVTNGMKRLHNQCYSELIGIVNNLLVMQTSIK